MDKFVYSRKPRNGLLATLGTSAGSAGVVWLGHLVQKLSFLQQPGYLQASGFGFVAKGISVIATPYLSKWIQNQTANEVACNLLGGIVAYGALQFTAAPITLPSALILTTLSIAISILFTSDKERIYGTIKRGTHVYVGEIQNNLPHGSGELTYGNRVIFKGRFNNGHEDTGTLRFNSCVVNNVQFTNHVSNEITFTWDGHTYKGCIKDGALNQGTIQYSSGDYLEYKGPIVDFKPHGQGTMTYRDNKGEYTGEFKNGHMDGKGVKKTQYQERDRTWAPLETYEGDWVNGVFINGTRTNHSRKESYTGPFENGLLHGKGKKTTADATFDGDWEKGVLKSGRIEYKIGKVYEGLWGEERVQKATITYKSHPRHVSYQGECRKGSPDGTGTMRYKDGSSYTGAWSQGSRQGDGVRTDNDGTTYTGKWESDKQHGSFQVKAPGGNAYTVEYRQGQVYEQKIETIDRVIFNGDWLDGKFVKGTIVYPDGNTYVGLAENNKPHGGGVMTSRNGDKYVGQFKNGFMDGEGVQTTADATYDGYWEEGNFKRGKITYKNGIVYDGEWEGQAYIQYPETHPLMSYNGECKNGIPHGTGTLKYRNDSGDTYTGSFQNGKRHGKGVLDQESENIRCEGNWENDELKYCNQRSMSHGGERIVYIGPWDPKQKVQGKIQYPNLTSYEGECYRGLPHGQGVMRYQDLSTNKHTGVWEHGKRQGRGVWIYGDTTYSGNWKEDLMDGPIEVTPPASAASSTQIYREGRRYSNEKRIGEDKVVYEGEWLDDDFINGKITYVNGDIYEGEVLAKKPHGRGTFTYRNKDKVIDATFEEGAINGKAVKILSNGRMDGVWEMGKLKAYTTTYNTGVVHEWPIRKDGKDIIKITYPPSSPFAYYEGECSQEYPQGPGTMVYKDGSRYEGMWEKGLRHGTGIFIAKDETTYSGHWVNDLKVGLFQITPKNSTTSTTQEYKDDKIYSRGQIRIQEANYDGELLDGKPHGKGVMISSNDDKYEGQWEEGRFKSGKIIYKNGIVYNGEWEGKAHILYPETHTLLSYNGACKNGVPHGEGTMSYRNAEFEIYTGSFVNGKRHGNGSLKKQVADITEKGIWKDDTLESVIETVKAKRSVPVSDPSGK